MELKITRTVMTEEQEQLFYRKTAKKTGKYFWAAVIFVLLFQVYNILYVLHYTDYCLGTKASRVYMSLYVIISVVCIISIVLGLLWSFRKKDNYNRLLVLYTVFGCLLLLWSVCLTVYDQRVSDNLSIYMTSAIYVAGLLYMKPQISIPFYAFCEALLMGGLLWIQQEGIKDCYGICVNSIALTLVAMFISLYRWRTLRQDFLNHLDIEQKNKEIMEQSEKLKYMADHDALTGLWNRNYLNEWTEKLFQTAGERTVAIFMIDIDFFKQYNDVFGHVAGDECLRKVARTMDKLREDLLFRYGGEEFLYLLVNPEDDSVEKLAGELCRYIEELKIAAANPGKNVTVSVGYSEGLMRNEEEFRVLLHEADEALYYAKSNGRNRAVGFCDIRDSGLSS